MDRTRTKSAHVVGYELNSTTRTRPDPHGPNGVSPQKKSVRFRSGPCRVRVVELSSSPTICADFVRVGSGPCRVRVVEFSYNTTEATFVVLKPSLTNRLLDFGSLERLD